MLERSRAWVSDWPKSPLAMMTAGLREMEGLSMGAGVGAGAAVWAQRRRHTRRNANESARVVRRWRRESIMFAFNNIYSFVGSIRARSARRENSLKRHG